MKKILKTVLFLTFAILSINVLSVSAIAADDIIYTVNVSNCTDGNDDGKIKVLVEDDNEDEVYYLSTNSGKTFNEMKGRSATVSGLEVGSHSVVLKNSQGQLSTITAVYITEESTVNDIEFIAESSPEQIYKDGYIRVVINNYNKNKKYEVSCNNGETWHSMNGHTFKIAGLEKGKYTVLVREKKSKITSEPIEITVMSVGHGNKNKIKIDDILQMPELPTGCEITSLTMLLNYIGFDVDKIEMADNYLIRGEYRASDYNEVFVGDPHSYFAYGCYNKVIEKTAEKFLKKNDKDEVFTVRNISGCSTSALYSAIDSGNPVIVWATMDMKEPKQGKIWTDEKTGNEVSWVAGEHCLILRGYDFDKQLVYVNDPLKGKVAYNMQLFEKRFKQLGNQAIIITQE